LPFSNHLYRLDSRNNRACGYYCPWALHGAQTAFDVPVIGFDAIVRVAAGSMPSTVMELRFLL
jgi:hypothetical protein